MLHRRHMPLYLIIAWALLDLLLFGSEWVLFDWRFELRFVLSLLLFGQFAALSGWVVIGKDWIRSGLTRQPEPGREEPPGAAVREIHDLRCIVDGDLIEPGDAIVFDTDDVRARLNGRGRWQNLQRARECQRPRKGNCS